MSGSSGAAGFVRANPKDAIIRRQVQSVEFGLYTDQNVRDRSVVEVTSSVAFDPNHNPLPGGLYDARMGCLASSSGKRNDAPCLTCACKSLSCPGHFGHIELAVPLYHPLLLGELLTCLRLQCFACHNLKPAMRQLHVLQAKFHLLYTHRISQLQQLDTELQAALGHSKLESGSNNNKANKAESIRHAGETMDAILQKYLPKKKQTNNDNNNTIPRRKTNLNSHERLLRRNLIKECIAACKQETACAHCGAHSPRLRHDSCNKIFQSALSATHVRLNAAEGIVISSALEANTATNYDSDDSQARRRVLNNSSGSSNNNRRRQQQSGGGGGEGDGEEKDDNNDEVMEDNDDEDEQEASRDKYMHPAEVQAQLQQMWQRGDGAAYLLNCLFGAGNDFSTDGYRVFFMQTVAVPPNRFRPSMALNGMAVEHAQTQQLSKLITLNEQVREAFAAGHEPRAYSHWIDLQTCLNIFMDNSKDPAARIGVQPPGIRQVLERKEGLFRKHMMGKRVDYCCRSVISPDPYIGTNEIGLPRAFATVLTYPTPVTEQNVAELRNLVERGPHHYPGAKWVELQAGRRIDLSRMNAAKRQAIAAQLLTRLYKSKRPSVVGRQLRNGDYVLMNRQPTLHKPGIMAHRVRILHDPTQKTIRMHYANCNTYNADYDGDEMNCHYPQNDIARAEAEYICQTDLQYIVPTDGSPLRGLIQDHVVGGVKLTKRDTFLEKWEYQQLLFACLASLPGLEVIRSNESIRLLPPAVMKPRELWTGKQVISTLLLHLSLGSDRDSPKMSNLPGISTERKAKTPETAFGPEQEEHLVLVRDGELLRGVLDKAAFGATDFSLVHAVYEAYGPEKAGIFLNALSRLFTAYIQYYAGHSCRTEDLILTKAADADRRELIKRAYNLGTRAAKAWADSEGGKVPIPPVTEQEGADSPLKPVEVAAASAKIGELLSGNEGSANFAALDGFMQGQLNPLASDIVKKALPSGLVVPFPFNSFGVMTTTGAKGSIVNQSQVICALGQQALEGRRVPRLSSGRTLPSFAPYDPNPRADGFVMDRFLTGIRPQEYYFHCMAGREGLVDTAVKTSRSGYLQRCLVKHLEELKICYDYTVRNAEGGVVQFLYGEDGLDPTKAAFLSCTDRTFDFLARNKDSLRRHALALPQSTIDIAAADASRDKAVKEGSGDLLRVGARVLARRLQEGTEWTRGALCRGWFEAIVTGTHEKGKFLDLEFLEDGRKVKRVPFQVSLGRCGGTSTPAISNVLTVVKPTAFDPLISSGGSRGHRLGVSGACLSERVASATYEKLRNDRSFQKTMNRADVTSAQLGELIGAMYSSSLCAPGEAVGSIAAQSVGEPSTQMTLNTFHLAGSGANVTLGIPRLREIIMTASKTLKTPTMSVPLHARVSEKKAIRLTRLFTKLTLMELISGDRGVTVTERLEKDDSGDWSRVYYIKLKFHPAERIREAFGLSLQDVAATVGSNFVPQLARLMKMELRRSAVSGDLGTIEVSGGIHKTPKKKKGADEEDEENGPAPDSGAVDELDDEGDDDERDVDDDAMGEEDGADAQRYRRSDEAPPEDEDDSQKADDDSASSVSSDEENEDEDEKDIRDDDSSEAMMDGKDTLRVNDKANAIILQSLRVDPAARPLLMVGLVEAAAKTTVVRARKNINEAYINEEVGRGRCLQTAGVNFSEIWKLESVDHNRLLSNDTWAVRCAYGVEAARNNIVEQIRSVFGAYGIEVDPRHLSLIADYMTFEGDYKGMNRKGMEATSSTFLQMSFETTANFLRQAALANDSDTLDSPSANVVMGRPIRHGTGSFTVMAKS